MQQSLIEGEKAQARAQDQARSQIRKIQTLLQLQKQERQVAGERMKELERTVGELEERRALLREKIAVKKDQVRTRLRSIGAAMIEGEAVDAQSVFVSENEGWETLTRHVQAGVARASVREIEELKVDLEDARMLEQQIETEKQQLAYLFQDIEEQEGVLQLNQQIQMDLIRREHQSRLAQLDHYRRLKLAESNVQKMLGEFNARRELQKQVEADRLKTRVQRAMQESIFGRQQGKLPMPVRGTIVGRFGKSLDPGSRLMVFKKGIEIQTEAGAPVTAVASGRVAFAGDLPNYGRVLILDHGDHYYSLSGHLGDIALKAGDSIEAGALVGHAEASGTPVYFEIRSRNIAVNPLQWVASSFSLNP
ncbi:MAG: murein hydrolase activator EnvC family protein [Oligoflexia bacterium]